jgi:RNA polymerase sigma factor (sigma-70 family)
LIKTAKITATSPVKTLDLFMTERGSVSLWIEQLRTGNADAAQPLWESYYKRLVGLARKKLGEMPRGAGDEEDVVQSAFNSFFQRLAAGQFPKLTDRDELWSLLVVITSRKAINHRAHQQRAKRGGGKVRNQAILAGPEESGLGLSQIIGAEPTPSFAAQVIEQMERVMELLDDPTHRVIALWKLEGRTNPEIARHLDCSLRAVERKLKLIRELFEIELSDINE